MEEILLKEYLNRGGSMSDSEFTDGMKSMMESKRYNRMRREGYGNPSYARYGVNRHSDHNLYNMIQDLDHSDKIKLMDMLSGEVINMDGGMYGMIDEHQAKYIVSHMYHTASGKKYIGEKFDMNKAKEVYSRYKGMFTTDASEYDVYIAINAQYHDYCELFKAWFGSNIDTKIIESAITFWFKDVDYTGDNKVYKYFMES